MPNPAATGIGCSSGDRVRPHRDSWQWLECSGAGGNSGVTVVVNFDLVYVVVVIFCIAIIGKFDGVFCYL